MANLASPTGRGGAVLIAADGSSTKRTTPDRLNAGSGSLNSTHVLTQTVAKRRSAMTRCMTAFAACLFVFELLRHLVFQGGKFCGELPRGAPVAVLLAGSAHAFNRTHCGLANRVIAPFTRLGHRVVVFAADENGDDDAMVPALERMRKDYPNVDFVIAPSSDVSRRSIEPRCCIHHSRSVRGVGGAQVSAHEPRTGEHLRRVAPDGGGGAGAMVGVKLGDGIQRPEVTGTRRGARER